MYITQIFSQPELRAGRHSHSKAGKGFTQGFCSSRSLERQKVLTVKRMGTIQTIQGPERELLPLLLPWRHTDPPIRHTDHTAARDGSPKAVIQGLGSQSKKLALLALASESREWALEPVAGWLGPAVLLCQAGAIEERPVPLVFRTEFTPGLSIRVSAKYTI